MSEPADAAAPDAQDAPLTVDVVVVTWKARDMLERCLEHLAAAKMERTKVIVVDNASADGSAELARAHPAVDVVVENPENVGFGQAVNAGAAAGDGDVVVLVNNDLFVEPGFVEAIVTPLRDDPRCGMVAGHTLLPDGAGTDGFGICLGPGLEAYNRGRGDLPLGLLAGPSGGAAAYRREAFDAAGGFDDRLFAYSEDVDLLLRLRLAGWTAAEAPGARGVHLGGASTGVDSPFQRRLAAFGRGFTLRRFGVLRRPRAALHALVLDGAVCVFGLLRHRSLTPISGRVRGWRAAGATPRLSVPPGTADATIGLREALRRLRTAR